MPTTTAALRRCEALLAQMTPHVFLVDGTQVATHAIWGEVRAALAAEEKDTFANGIAAAIDIIRKRSAQWAGQSKADAEELAASVRDLSNVAAEEKGESELVAALKAVSDLIGESKGVIGFHLNGDVAEWGEFDLVNRIDAILAKHATPEAPRG